MNNPKNRMERRWCAEWQILGGFYSLGLLIYILAQLTVGGSLSDFTFLFLLTLATLFLNYRQKDLYYVLTQSKEGRGFFSELYERGEEKKQIINIFLKKENDIFACVFAIIFCSVIWYFHVWEDSLLLKSVFVFFLFTANIPTGLAIIRLLKYFYYSRLWIKNIDFRATDVRYHHIRFVRKMRSKTLLTASLYCTLSLSSILFTSIELNMIVLLYTIFAVALLLLTLLITETMLYSGLREYLDKDMDQVNCKIMNEIHHIIYSGKGSRKAIERLGELMGVKECLVKQTETRFDFSKFLSNLGILLITILPIALQWVLELI